MTLGAAALWALLAVLRPTVSYHLGPAVVAFAYPATRWSRPGRPSPRGAVVSAVTGGAFAATVTVVLHAVGYLRGPALFGGSAAVEGLVVAAVAAVVAAGVGLARTVLHRW